MLKWTRDLIDQTVLAFNEGETQKTIAERLNIKTKTVSRLLCRARDGAPGHQPRHVERRAGFKKNTRKDLGKCAPQKSSN